MNQYYLADLCQAKFLVNEIQKLMPNVEVRLEQFDIDSSRRYIYSGDDFEFLMDNCGIEIKCRVFYKNLELGKFRKYIHFSKYPHHEYILENLLSEIKEVLNKDYSNYSHITPGSLVYYNHFTRALTQIKVIDIVKAYEEQESGLFALVEYKDGTQIIQPVQYLYTLEEV